MSPPLTDDQLAALRDAYALLRTIAERHRDENDGADGPVVNEAVRHEDA